MASIQAPGSTSRVPGVVLEDLRWRAARRYGTALRPGPGRLGLRQQLAQHLARARGGGEHRAGAGPRSPHGSLRTRSRTGTAAAGPARPAASGRCTRMRRGYAVALEQARDLVADEDLGVDLEQMAELGRRLEQARLSSAARARGSRRARAAATSVVSSSANAEDLTERLARRRSSSGGARGGRRRGRGAAEWLVRAARRRCAVWRSVSSANPSRSSAVSTRVGALGVAGPV